MANEAKQYNLSMGDKARDTISEFEGIIIAITHWIYGCDRVTIQPQGLDKDGKVRQPETFDALQVVKVQTAAVPSDTRATKTGGPQEHEASALSR